jgi:release factor glutamine methyltransferase
MTQSLPIDLRTEIEALLARASRERRTLDADLDTSDPGEEARLIVAEALRRAPLDSRETALGLARRRQAGELLGHVLGRMHFLDCDILTAPDCLVPRKETEILGRLALEVLTGRQLEAAEPPRCIDMCCGAGNLACAIATHVDGSRVWACDLTDGCVQLASRNVEHLGLSERVVVRQGDLFAAVADAKLEGQIDLVVCNPPYISSGRLAADRAELLEREPREAFDGGPYGLSIHQRVLRDALGFLRPDGWLLFEVGAGQQRQLELLVRRSAGAYGPVRWVADAAGTPRAAALRRTGEAAS